ncbi:hypothetical protein ABFX02_02G074200 [Erythranthe guttata]
MAAFQRIFRFSKSTSPINPCGFFSSISSRRMSRLVKPYDDGMSRLVKPYDDGGIRIDRTDLERHLEAQGIQGKHVPIITSVLNRSPNVYVVNKDIYFRSLYKYVDFKRDFVFGDPNRTTAEKFEDAVLELIPYVGVCASFLVYLGVLYRVKN